MEEKNGKRWGLEAKRRREQGSLLLFYFVINWWIGVAVKPNITTSFALTHTPTLDVKVALFCFLPSPWILRSESSSDLTGAWWVIWRGEIKEGKLWDSKWGCSHSQPFCESRLGPPSVVLIISRYEACRLWFSDRFRSAHVAVERAWWCHPLANIKTS